MLRPIPILFLLGLINAAHAAPICKVLIPNIASNYKGGCKDGLADGLGKAWSSDASYEGNFRDGWPHGIGIYKWAGGASFQGEFSEGLGVIGTSRMSKDSPRLARDENLRSKGSLKGDMFEATGIWRNGEILETCPTVQACKAVIRQEQEAKRAAIANACDRFYPGKAIGFQPAGFIYFGSVLDAVVLGKGSGNVSIKITDTHFDGYGKTLEVPCTSDQLK